jgi:hypothetical protein
MASVSTVFFTQVDGLGYDADPAAAVNPNLILLPGRTLKISGSTSGGVILSGDALGVTVNILGNVSVDGLQVSDASPTLNQTIQANGCAYIFGQPLHIPAGVCLTVSAGAILRVGL